MNRDAKRSSGKRRQRALLSCLLCAALALAGAFPGTAAEQSRSHAIACLDDDGYLYYMDYALDYYGPEVMDALRKGGFIDAGCSSFSPTIRRGIPSPAGTMTTRTASPGRTGR